MRCLALVLLAGLSAPAAAQESGEALAQFAPLIGHCYENGTPETGIDRHCWSEVEDTGAVRQAHALTGGAFDGYSGEAVYQNDPESGQTRFLYRSSDGGVSRGTVRFENGRLVSSDELSQNPDGSKIRILSAWEIFDSDRYITEFAYQIDGVWGPPTYLEFVRVDAEQRD